MGNPLLTTLSTLRYRGFALANYSFALKVSTINISDSCNIRAKNRIIFKTE